MPAYTRILPLTILYIVAPELTNTLYTYLPSDKSLVSPAVKVNSNFPPAALVNPTLKGC